MRHESRNPYPWRRDAQPGPELAGTNLARAGDHNQRVTLHAIRVNGPVTRHELSEQTGLTPAAIANITARLLKNRLILDAGRRRGQRGQPASKFVVNPDGGFSIGLNVDRDHVTLVIVDFAGRARARSSREIAFAQPVTLREFFRRSVGHLLAKSAIDRARLVGIGIAFPDDIARAHLPDQPQEYAAWSNVRVDDLLRDVLGIPIFIENDAAAAAIGEMQFGAGHKFRTFFYLLVTAALGGGLVIDGHYFRGATGRSGEIGWLRAHAGVGERAQLQNIVSLSNLCRMLAVGGHRIASPAGLARLEPGARAIVTRWIEESSAAMVEPLLAVNCLINPEAILIGGRLPGGLIDQLAAALNRRLADHAGQIPAVAPVQRAQLADDAPAVGAAILAFNARLLPLRDALWKPG